VNLPLVVGPSEVSIERKPRLLALDLVRLLAMLMMIQGHTLDVLLKPDYQGTNWFNIWQFVRGFTAPGFLTLSGFTFVLATSRSWQEHLTLSPRVWRRVRRFGLFLLLGYTMHFPVHRILDLRWLDTAGWCSGLQVDVLQTIGMTLLLLQVFVFIARTPRRFAVLTLSSCVAVVAATVFMWNSAFASHLPLVFASYVNGHTGSLFPLFPWSAYVLMGAGLGALYVSSKETSPRPFAHALAVAGFLLAVIGFRLQPLVMKLYSRLDFWHTSPSLFMIRAGIVLLAIGIALHLTHLPARFAEIVLALAPESLLVYFVHVCILYGSIWNPGLRQYYGNRFDLQHAAIVAAALIVLVLSMAYGWSRCKRAGRMPAFALRTLAVFAAAWSLS
jgi:uncharacterized membrane protein